MPAPYSRWLPEVKPLETRKTFVLWLSREPLAGGDSDTTLGGRLEDVDTGRELRFRSVEQLVAFLNQCMDSDEVHENEQ